jgi:hypothetical protein
MYVHLNFCKTPKRRTESKAGNQQIVKLVNFVQLV